MKWIVRILEVLIVFVVIPAHSWAQTRYRSASSSIVIEGTSTMRDWAMTSSNGSAVAVFVTNDSGRPVKLNTLSFTMGSSSIKSGVEGMDDNAFKALKTKEYQTIQFTAGDGSVTPAGINMYQVKCNGILTVAGKELSIELISECNYSPGDGSLMCSGIKNLRMTDFGIKPPTFMMGTLKTGDDITVKFSSLLKK